jgi:hypothetical protein
MMYLLVEHPAMLPVSTNVQDVLASKSDRVRLASSKDDIFDKYYEGDRLGVSAFWWNLLKCISELPSSFHQFGLLVALASA